MRTPRNFLTLASCFPLAALCPCAPSPVSAQEGSDPVVVEIGTLQAQMKYDTAEFTVPPSARVRLVLSNSDDLPHNLVVCTASGVGMAVAQAAWELAENGFEKQWIPDDARVLAATGMIDPKAKGSVLFDAPEAEGRYDYVCTYPGHAVLMKGVMIVRAGGGAQEVAPQEESSGPIKELTYTLYKGQWDRMPDFSALQPEATDSLNDGLIDLAAAGGLSEAFAVVFEGSIHAPQDGEFTFLVASDDGSQVFVDDRMVVDHDGVHARSEKSGSITLAAGFHRLRVTYFERSGEESLSLRWQGPGVRGRAGRLSKGGERPPANQEVTGIPLVPGDKPLIYRNFIAGAGNRAIGVGFPGGVSMAFDADQLRLALMWTGDFIDAARHWQDRGQGYQPPAGDNLITAPEGEAFALLASVDAAWPEPAARAPHSRFKGYRLRNKGQLPEFLYRIGDAVDIADSYAAVVSRNGRRALERSISCSGSVPAGSQLVMRVASGEMAQESAGSYLSAAGQRLTISGAAAILHGAELLVPVVLDDGRATVSITYEWLAAEPESTATPQ